MDPVSFHAEHLFHQEQNMLNRRSSTVIVSSAFPPTEHATNNVIQSKYYKLHLSRRDNHHYNEGFLRLNVP